MNDRDGARFLRAAVIKNLFAQGQLERDDALELLNAPLNPDDPSTISDDRELLDLTSQEFNKRMADVEKEKVK